MNASIKLVFVDKQFQIHRIEVGCAQQTPEPSHTVLIEETERFGWRVLHPPFNVPNPKGRWVE